MKVLQTPDPWKWQTTCPYCKAGLEVEASDIKFGGFMSGWSETEDDFYYMCGHCSSTVRETTDIGNGWFVPVPVRKLARENRD